MVKYSTIVHALGSQTDRYFGTGHRRSTYDFTPSHVTPDQVKGTGRVTQQGLWSAKSAGTVSRHLSTLDAMALAALALDHSLRLGPVPTGSLFISEVEIRAGSIATTSLDDTELDGQLTWSPASRTYLCTAAIGTMKVSLTLRPLGTTLAADQDDELDDFHATHLRNRIQYITELNMDCPGNRMTARLGTLLARGVETAGYRGIQSSHPHLFSASEAIVCLAQLAQAIAYEYDQVPRCESSNFWLRRLTITLHPPYLTVGDAVDVDVAVEQSAIVALHSTTWRKFRLRAASVGLSAVADVAHALPENL